MMRWIRYGMLAAGLLAAHTTAARAQRDSTSEGVRVDPSATNALARMGNYLRSLKAFQVKADVTTEEVLPDGRKVQVASRIEGIADKPNRLRVQLSSDRKQREFLYDGTNFTVFSRRRSPKSRSCSRLPRTRSASPSRRLHRCGS